MPHDNALLVTLKVANFDVKRVLVDGGSSADIFFYDAYKKMKLGAERLKRVDSPLYGFLGAPVKVELSIELPTTAGTGACKSTIKVNFLVIKVPHIISS